MKLLLIIINWEIKLTNSEKKKMLLKSKIIINIYFYKWSIKIIYKKKIVSIINWKKNLKKKNKM